MMARGLAHFFAFATIFAGPLSAAPGLAADSASIILYHRFAESAHPSTSVTLEQFDSHLEEIAEGGYTVLPLPEIVAAFREGRTLPDRTIALTVDDAFLSVYRVAWPRLKAAGLPFTLFVATEPVDRNHPGYMSWDQIRELRAAGVTIGSQTASHPHLPKVGEQTVVHEIERANARFEAELTMRPDLLAYPYGEAGQREMRLAQQAGFVAAFGQHSGVAHRRENIHYLPRFSMNEAYGDRNRFRLVSRALPLSVSDWTPADTVLRGANPPPIGFTVLGDHGNLQRLTCFASHTDGVETVVLGGMRVEIRVDKPLPRGRARVNCTLPGTNGRWHWVGRQILVP